MSISFLGTISMWLGHFVSSNSYGLLFIGMLIEGPAITAAGAFAAALGALNLWIVFGLSVLGNLIPDIIFYFIGYWGRTGFLDKYGHYFGATKKRMEMAEKLIEKHSGKSLIAIKLIPFIALPGLIMAGATKMDIKKYTLWSLGITIPSSLLYLALGYYFGAAYHSVIHYLNLSILIIAGGIIVFFIIVWLQKKLTNRLAKDYLKDPKTEDR